MFMATHCYIRYALEIPSYINMKITVALKKVLIVSRETVVLIMPWSSPIRVTKKSRASK